MAVGQARPALAGVKNVVDRTADTDRAAGARQQRLRSAQRIAGCRTAVNAARLNGGPGHAHDLGRIAADHRGWGDGQQLFQRLVAVRRGTSTHRVQHRGNAALRGRRQRQLHAANPVRIERANVEHQRLGDSHHVAHFLMRMRHHRRGASGQQHVGVEVDDDQVGDAVHQRRALTHGQHIGPEVCGRKSGKHFFLGAGRANLLAVSAQAGGSCRGLALTPRSTSARFGARPSGT